MDETCPKRTNWFLLGAAFGLFAYPFYAVLLDIKPRRRVQKA